MRLTANFTKAEFDSKDGAPMPLQVLQNVKKLAENLQKIRDRIGMPITITSGYRSPRHNRNVGGKIRSMHLTGNAADIKADGMQPVELAKVIKQMMDAGEIEKGGLKAYTSWVHYDRRGFHVSW